MLEWMLSSIWPKGLQIIRRTTNMFQTQIEPEVQSGAWYMLPYHYHYHKITQRCCRVKLVIGHSLDAWEYTNFTECYLILLFLNTCWLWVLMIVLRPMLAYSDFIYIYVFNSNSIYWVSFQYVSSCGIYNLALEQAKIHDSRLDNWCDAKF